MREKGTGGFEHGGEAYFASGLCLPLKHGVTCSSCSQHWRPLRKRGTAMLVNLLIANHHRNNAKITKTLNNKRVKYAIGTVQKVPRHSITREWDTP